MSGIAPFLLLSAAVFLGSLVSGFAGFAFSAVAGAILLHVLPPMEAVPLMMLCSVAVQAANLWALRQNIQWKESLPLNILAQGPQIGGLHGDAAEHHQRNGFHWRQDMQQNGAGYR